MSRPKRNPPRFKQLHQSCLNQSRIFRFPGTKELRTIHWSPKHIARPQPHVRDSYEEGQRLERPCFKTIFHVARQMDK